MILDKNTDASELVREIINSANDGRPFDVSLPIFTADDLANNPQPGMVPLVNIPLPKR